MRAQADHETALLRELDAAEQAAFADTEAEAEAAAEAGAAAAAKEGNTADGDLSETDRRALAEKRALAASIDDLREQGKVEALLLRAGALRRSSDDASLGEALECYQAAEELGSPDATFAIGLFYLNGVVLAAETNLGLGKLREAAGDGHLRSRIYLGNAYELGIGREPDKKKANVWYRGVARALSLDFDENSREFARRMADLGCIRYARQFLRDEELSKKERLDLLRSARDLGHGLQQRLRTRERAEKAAIAAEVEAAAAAALEEAADEDGAALGSKDESVGESQKKLKERKQTPKQHPSDRKSLTVEERKERIMSGNKRPMGERLTAFGAAAFVLALGSLAAVFASRGAYALREAGEAIPLLGTRANAVFPLVIAVTLLPILLFYNIFSVLLAAAVGAVAGSAGWMFFQNGTLRLLADANQQMQAFAVGGIVLALFVLALAGKVRKRRFEP